MISTFSHRFPVFRATKCETRGRPTDVFKKIKCYSDRAALSFFTAVCFFLLVIKLQNAHEGFLRNFDGTYLSHSLLTFLLLLEELLLT